MAANFGSRLKKIDDIWFRFESILNLVAGSLIFCLMFLGVLQIILRTVFRTPIYGYIDIIELAMVGFAVLSISFVQQQGGHVRMELLVSRLHGRSLWLAEAASSALSLFIVGVLIPYSYKHFLRAYSFGDSTIDIELTIWPAKLIIPVALSILFVRLAIQMIGYTRLVISPGATPIAVPLIKDVESQAEEEIHQAEENIDGRHS